MRDWLTRQRDWLPPAAGALAMLVAMFWLQLPLVVTLILGALVWGGTALMLAPDDPFGHLAGAAGLGLDGRRIAEELAEAQQRVERLRAAAPRLGQGEIPASLARIAEQAQHMIAEIAANPADYRRIRKSLRHYLDQVDRIADTLVRFGGVDHLEQGLAGRMRSMLADVEIVFQDYRRRLREKDAFDLDTRIRLLESEVRGEGVPFQGPDRDRAGPDRAGPDRAGAERRS